jgi:hypothetical protein
MSEKQAQANRRNALKSTGPKTPTGKALASMNALKHGLRASSLAVPVLEDVADWETHLSQTVRALAPVGYLETILSERAASILWRLGRAVRYESLVIGSSMENAEDERASGSLDRPPDLQDLRDKVDQAQENAETFAHLIEAKLSSKVDAGTAWGIVTEAARVSEVELWDGQEEGSPSILDLSEIPEDVEVDEWTGWTAGYLRGILGQVAKKAGLSQGELVESLTSRLKDEVQESKEILEKAARSLETWRKAHLLPDETTLDKVSRYETTLERSLFRTIHELQRLQAARAGEKVPLPAVVDGEVSISRER